MSVLGEMFENVTHQWKQPLSIINIGCSTLKMSYEFDELTMDEVITTVDMITAESEYLSQTIDDFRDFAREDNERELFDMRTLFEHAIEILSFRLSKIEIEVSNGIKSFKYRSCKNYIIQVFINILNNAMDILEKSGKGWIKASSRVEDDFFVVSICDSGGGIKAEDISSIFEKYVTTKEEKDGAGLGLYMTKEILQKKVDAEIVAYNEEEGACFEIRFKFAYAEGFDNATV
jgi:nitrogen fixation/metabolism regulation signal transduction histidine kinase